MNYLALVQAAAAVLAVSASLAAPALAQESSSTTPTPARMTDAGPAPASERDSVGAVILMDEPVIAQREYLEMLARQGLDTRVMGGAPSPRKTLTKEEIDKRAKPKAP